MVDERALLSQLEASQTSPKSTSTRRLACTVVAVIGIVVVVGLALSLGLYYGLRHEVQFLWFNDVHFDPFYIQDSYFAGDPSAQCRSAWKSNDSESVRFLWGQYGCDAPIDVYESMLNFVKGSLKLEPSFVVFGGDVIAHSLPFDYDAGYVAGLYRFLVNRSKTFFPDSPLLVSIGNHDFPSGSTWDSDGEVYRTVGAELGLVGDHQRTWETGAYYDFDVPGQDLRILFLNTPIYYFGIDGHPERNDPNGQFHWVGERIAAAKSEGKRVGISVHVQASPCSTAASTWEDQVWRQVYLNQFRPYLNQVDFILSAHSHWDLLMPLHNSSEVGEPAAWELSAPALESWGEGGGNPAFRVGKIRKGVLIDYDQYYADILTNPDVLLWEKEYSFRKSWGVRSLERGELMKAAKKMSGTRVGQEKVREYRNARARPHDAYFQCLMRHSNLTEIRRCLYKLNDGA